VHLFSVQTFTTTTFFDDNGVMTQRITHGTEQDTFSANGTTLQGDPYWFTFVSDFVDGVRFSREDGSGRAGVAGFPLIQKGQ
jgi:hypothetical protein